MNMLLNLKKKIQKKQERRLIKKLTHCYERLDVYFYDVYDGVILHCPNCRESLNLYGDILYKNTGTDIVDHIKCNLCDFELYPDYAPFISNYMNKMLKGNKKLEKWVDNGDKNKILDRSVKLVNKMNHAKNKLVEFYIHRDGYIVQCPNCKQLLNQYGHFDPSNETDKQSTCKPWHCDNCGITTIWSFCEPRPECIGIPVSMDITKNRYKREKEKLCQIKKQSDN